MAIQNRRGVYSDFTPSKMVPGELAVVQSGDPNNTSGKAVYAAFGASGDVKRLATEDDLGSVDTALGNKVDKVTGKGLSTNDYTTAEKNKLSGIEAQANKTVIDSTLTQTGQAADAKAVGDAIDSVTIETDKTLTEEDVPADAKVVGDELADVKSDLSDMQDEIDSFEGISDEVKEALLACFENVAWVGRDGQDYYNDLHDALYGIVEVVSIEAIFNQGGNVIYEDSTLDDLKPYLTVIGTLEDGTTRTITDYVLSGSLTVGTSTITVSYQGKTDTFTVIVTGYPAVFWDYSLGRLPSSSDGILTVQTGSNTTVSFNSSEGLYVSGGLTSNDNVRYSPENFLTMTKGSFECTFKITSLDTSAQLNPRLSDGTSGVNVGFTVLSNNKSIVYKVGSAGTNEVIGNFDINTEYLLRVEYDKNGTNQVYLNNELIYETADVSSYYTTENRFFLQGNITCYVKNFKWTIKES